MKTLTKTQLAWQYSPELSQNSALNRLHRWIHGDQELLAALRATGYRDSQRVLTSKQLAIIYEYIGTPEAA